MLDLGALLREILIHARAVAGAVPAQGRAFVVPLVLVVLVLSAGCLEGGRDRARSDPSTVATPAATTPAIPTAPVTTPASTSPPVVTATTTPMSEPGTDTRGPRTVTLSVGGVEREFVPHVPTRVVGPVLVPVVLMLHGSGGNGTEFYGRSGWVEKADDEGFIAVFPTALRHCYGEDDDRDGNITQGEYRIGTKWASGKLGSGDLPLCTEDQLARLGARAGTVESRSAPADDLAFFDALVAWLTEELPADPERLFVTGFSNGGSMSGRLLVERTETFAAFAMQAGGPTVQGRSARPVPVWFSVGALDDGFTAAAGVAQFPVDESFLDVAPIRALADALAAHAHVNATGYDFAPRQLAGTTLGTFRFDEAQGESGGELIVMVIEDATHQYPNGNNHPVDMADLLWSFFTATRR